MVEFENGRLVYTEDGFKAEYLGKVDNGHVVKVYGESLGDYGERFEEPIGLCVVARVFAEPPAPVYAEKIIALKAELEAIEKRHEELCNEMADARRERLELDKKLREIPALRHLNDFIEKRITHVLRVGYGYEILTVEQAFAENGVYSRKGQKLLALYGDASGNLTWRLNQYSDGSGWAEDVVPCLSLDEAEQCRRERIADDLIAAMGEYEMGRKYRLTVAVKAADQFGVEVTAEQRSAFAEAEAERLEKERVDVERNASTYALKLADIDASLSALKIGA